MANQKISQLSNTASASDSDELLLTQSGSSVALALSVLRTQYMEPSFDIDSVPFTSITGTITATNVGDAIREVQNELLALDADSVAFTSVTGNLTANNVGDALRELQDDLLALDADTISFTSVTGNLTANNVGDALRELQDDILTLNADTIAFSSTTGGLTSNNVGDALRELQDDFTALDADAIPFLSVTGGLTSTNVGDALRELQDEIVGGGGAVWSYSGSDIYYNSGNVGIGTTSMDGLLHVFSGNAGTTASGLANEAVFENSADCGISLMSPDANASLIHFTSPSMVGGANISWGYNAGKLTIATTVTGAYISFKSGLAGENMRLDDDSTSGNTRLMIYDVDNATLERVSVGAADSGGAGYKVLRIPN